MSAPSEMKYQILARIKHFPTTGCHRTNRRSGMFWVDLINTGDEPIVSGMVEFDLSIRKPGINLTWGGLSWWRTETMRRKLQLRQEIPAGGATKVFFSVGDNPGLLSSVTHVRIKRYIGKDGKIYPLPPSEVTKDRRKCWSVFNPLVPA